MRPVVLLRSELQASDVEIIIDIPNCQFAIINHQNTLYKVWKWEYTAHTMILSFYKKIPS